MKSSKNKGAVLIEFVFGVPVLILMMYFCLDIPRAYQLINKLTTSADVAAHLISNVHSSAIKSTITENELKAVGRALEIYFVGNPQNDGYDFNIAAYLTCITGSNDVPKINWRSVINVNTTTHNVTISDPNNVERFSTAKSSMMLNSLNFSGTEIEGFEIIPGETKLIIETFIWKNDDTRGFNKLFYMLSLPLSLIGNKFAIISAKDCSISEKAPTIE